MGLRVRGRGVVRGGVSLLRETREWAWAKDEFEVGKKKLSFVH